MRWFSSDNNKKDEKGSIKSLSRKFYKLVHPDRFINFPEQKKINEQSLKQLISLINALSGESNSIGASTDRHINTMDESHKLQFFIFPTNKNTSNQQKNETTEKTIETNSENLDLKTIESIFNPKPLHSRLGSNVNLYSHLQSELKTTLINLFTQANLPCNFVLEKIERECFWEQAPSEVNLRQFLIRYGLLAQERAERRKEIEKEITILRTAFHFRKKLAIQTSLPNIMYKQENMIAIPLQGDPSKSTDFVDPIITPYSAAMDIYGNEYVELNLALLNKLSSVIDQTSDGLHNCNIVFSDKTEADLPYLVDSQGRIHLHYQQSESDWLKLLNSIEIDQVHDLTLRYRNLKTAENTLSYRLGFGYISAHSFDFSTTQEYQNFVQNLIHGINKGSLKPEDFHSGLYKKMSLVIVPTDDSNFTDKYFTGDSNGLIIPSNCSIERLKEFISKHAEKRRTNILNNIEQDEKEVSINFLKYIIT